jgi:ubiquinone/menaquinone biosynthesis C-methylase UbiE
MSLTRDAQGIETAILERIARPHGARVLEVRCGDGRLTWRYAHLAEHTTGIDPDRSRLVTALGDRPAPLRGRVDFVAADAEHLPLRKGAFDLAILSWSL